MGSKGSNKVQTAQAQTYTPDPRIQQAGYQALSGAQAAAGQPFQMPQAPIAGFTPFQQQAFGATQNALGMAQPFINQGSQFLQQSAAPITGADVSQYYNPMAQNVTNQLQNIFGRQMQQTTGQATQAAGGVGADRIGVAQANLANQQGLAAGQTYAGLYQQALQAAQQQRQMEAGAGYGLGQLGPAAQAAQLQSIGALGAAGTQQQALAQAQLNAPYQQQLAQIAYPFQTSQYLAGITGGLAPALGGTTAGQGTTTYPTPSPLNQALGIGTAGIGLLGSAGVFGGGGGKGTGYGATYGAPSGGWGSYGGIQYPTFASGGAADNQDDSDQPPPFPIVSIPKTHGLTPIPYVPLQPGGGQFHNNLNLSPPQQQKDSGSGIGSALGSVAKIAATVLPFLARGGSVNPYDFGQGFYDGGYATDIEAEQAAANKANWMSDVAATPAPSTTDQGLQANFPYETASGNQDIDVPYATAEAGPETSPYPRPAPNVPLPRGRPDTVGGVQSTMANEWARAGMPPVGISGINMNVYDESKFNPGLRHFDQPNPRFRGTEAQNAHGLYQEGGDEWNNYQNWLQTNAPGSDWRDPALQSRFTAWNLKNNYPQVWAQMQNAKTPGEAAAAFAKGYLKPASQQLSARVRKYLGGEGEEDLPEGATPSGFQRGANPDMTMASMQLPRGQMPYPGATQHDWGQAMARSPWMSLVKAGAQIASTVGPVGTAIGKGIAAGAGELEGQRKALQSEEQINQKADALFQEAKKHLDTYQRMTPYQHELLQAGKGNWVIGGIDAEGRPILVNRHSGEERPSQYQFTPTQGGTALQRNMEWLKARGVAKSDQEAFELAHSGVNNAATYGRLIQAEKKYLSGLPDMAGKSDSELEATARSNVENRGFRPVGAAPVKQPLPMPTDPDQLVKGESYMTKRGAATWDGSKFVQ